MAAETLGLTCLFGKHLGPVGSFLLHCFACGLVTRPVPHLLRVQSGVHTLVLPAAHETVETWKAGFNFVDMPEDDVR